jgi:hypothetical protein
MRNVSFKRGATTARANREPTIKDETTMSIILVVALLAPVAVIAAINVSLYLTGERGTLLLPARSAYPLTGLDMMPVAKAPASAPAEVEFVEEMRLAA